MAVPLRVYENLLLAPRRSESPRPPPCILRAHGARGGRGGDSIVFRVSVCRSAMVMRPAWLTLMPEAAALAIDLVVVRRVTL